MFALCKIRLMTAAIVFCAVSAAARAQDVAADPVKLNTTIQRGLGFLVKDALAWKAEHNCVSCHHAGLVIWALHEAKGVGQQVDEPVLAELTKWVAESGSGVTGVPRPKDRPKALNAKPIWLGLGLEADPKPDEVSRKGLNLMWNTIKSDQVENGSWVAWPETRPPFFGGSDDSMTALATLAILPAAASGDPEAVAVRDKGMKWLIDTKTDDDPQSVAIRLVLWKRLNRPDAECEPLVERFKTRQNADGGWSQAPDMASDPWATGQALYALAHAGLKPDDPTLLRAQTFLIRTQQEDGSWPMTSRPTKPGGKGSTSLIPITGGGAAWGVLGLVRSSAPAK